MATFALILWPLIAVGIFLWRGPVHGLIWSVLIGHLTLPEAFALDLPGLPPYHKGMAVMVGCILGAFATRSRERVPFSREQGPTKIMAVLIAALIFSPFLTAFNNGERLFYGPTVVPSLGLRDGIAMVADSLVLIVLFLMSRRYLFTESTHRALLRAIVLSGVVYTFPILFELRLSPQIHTWTYGYFQHIWVQHVRGGGFRPVVYLPHGLWIGLLLYMTVIAAVSLWRREREENRLVYLLMGGWLLLVLLVSRNLGAVMLAVLFLPAMLMLPRRALVWIAASVSIFFLTFPAARQAEMIPLDGIVSLAAKISEERAGSLEYRFVNEDAFLERAAGKPLTGWGVWARWRIWDDVTGEEISTSDGLWVSYLGERGWVGYIALFGLLTLPIFYLRHTEKKRGQRTSMTTVGMTAIMAGNLIYLIPNNALSPLSILVAGALAGYVQKRPAEDPDGAVSDPEQSVLKPRERTIRYTRFNRADQGHSEEGEPSV